MTRSTRPIRARVTLVATVLVAVVLVAFAVVVVIAQQAQLRGNLDNSLEQRADLVRDQIAGGRSVVTSDDEDRFTQVLDGEGRVVLASENVAGAGALAALPSGDQAFSTSAALPVEDDEFRILVKRYEEDGRFVVVGENVDDLRDGMWALITALAVSIPVTLAVLAAVIWWIVGRTLRPVEELRREVADIGLDRLDRRVRVPDTDDEIARLAATMNDMLVRLERSAERQRRFVADASHELRTPLTRMRTALEVDLGRDDADLAETASGALDDTIEMQHLIDDLLFLARHDAGQTAIRFQRVDLDAIVEAEVREARAMVPSGPGIDMSAVSAAVVRGDASQLRRLVRNLLTNAVRHAASSVRVRVVDGPDRVVLVVQDDGPGIPPADRERVLERFVRLDEARTDRDGGAGLGLAIVKEIVLAHGGTIRVSGADEGVDVHGARVEVTLPAVG
ncbi:MAG: HAMP domain-containing sensor histidine kinase [Ilumatobacter sp.]|uniref:sensor histidine kinase n=1 Tax=Ilumatobacter sp. TaxID=1967498 RepID=UPI002617A543|nr:HAMP domain-containing sensor histidine kinase [Ilumatobacter sp.]MDJ0768453.1 HAMP domain-containing sensor histidine kinase [Ilumatobacter sp.]